MFKEAAALARERKMAVILRLTTHVCHAKEKVAFAAYAARSGDDAPRFDVKNGPYVPIAAAVFPLKRRALQKLEAFREYAERSPHNLHIDHGNKRHGVVTSGTAFLALGDALAFCGDLPDIIKLGITHPLPKRLLADFLQDHAQVLVLEELDDILETEIRALAQGEGIGSAIIGKSSSEDWIGEYTPERVVEKLEKVWPGPAGAAAGKDGHAAARAAAAAAVVPGLRPPFGFLCYKKSPGRQRYHCGRYRLPFTRFPAPLSHGPGPALHGGVHRHRVRPGFIQPRPQGRGLSRRFDLFPCRHPGHHQCRFQ